jgi:hypothetical protein
VKFIRQKSDDVLITRFTGTLVNESTMFADDYLEESGGGDVKIVGFPASATWNASFEIIDIADTSYIDSNGGWSDSKFIYDGSWSQNPDWVDPMPMPPVTPS